MGKQIEVRVPDIGDFDEVDVMEVLIVPGDQVEVEQGLVTLESDKASMEVPSTDAGTVVEVRVRPGHKVASGDVVAVLEVAPESSDPASSGKDSAASAATAAPGPTPTTANQSAPATELSGDELQTEIVVLGSGPGGYTAAFRAADLGRKVVLVERYPVIGGVCLNVGCIPSKALLHGAKVIEEAEAFADHGITFGPPKVDIDRLRSWKDGVVKRLTGGLKTMSKQRKVEVVEGTGRFVDANTLAVDGPQGERRIRFEQAIIAAGSQAVKIPGFPWDDPRLMDSTDALVLADVPASLLLVGGGIIGLEMATVYSALGSKISVVELLDRLMPGADADIVRPLQKRIAKRYEAIWLGAKVTAIEARDEGLLVRFEGGDAPAEQLFDRVLVAVGRSPNGAKIGAEAAGVAVDERGFIPVDHQQRTNVPHIFAIGDIVGQPMLAHKATHEAKVAAEVASGEKSAFDARVIPSVAYTDPEVAWVGLTEERAKADGINYEKASFPWAASGRALALGRDEGLTKLLFDPESQRVLGAGIVGPNAGDLISEVALAIEMDCEAADIGLTVHPHPTLSETVAMAAEAFEGTLTDLYLPKKAKR